MTCRGGGVGEDIGGVGVPPRWHDLPALRTGAGLWIKRCCWSGGVGLSASLNVVPPFDKFVLVEKCIDGTSRPCGVRWCGVH